MQEMIVLGQIPGTNIQIDFTMWLYTTTCVCLLLMLLLSQGKIRNYWHSHIANVRARKVWQLLSQYHLL
jgi:hypothetical protein